MSAPAESVRPLCSDSEWQARVDLAALYRLFVRYGWTDLIYTHISARVPDEPDRYLINSYGLFFDEITASSLLKVDFDGNVVDDRGLDYNEAGHLIHSAVLKARPDINYVLHTHSRAGTAVSAMKCGLLGSPSTPTSSSTALPTTSTHRSPRMRTSASASAATSATRT